MTFDAVLAPDPTREQAVTAAWAALIGPGPVLRAGARQDAIRGARAAWRGAPAPDVAADPAGAAVHWLAVDAGGITIDAVRDLEARGLDRLAYLELVGVVARLSNIDFYLTGIGAQLPSLDGATDADPTGDVAAGAAIADMWVPQVSAVIAPLVLDALPAEGRAFRAIHEPMYLPLAEIGSWDWTDSLSRPQIEYLAARVSYLNECFY